MRDDDLATGIDSHLPVIGLHEAVATQHDPAVGVSEVALGCGFGRARRRYRFATARLMRRAIRLGRRRRFAVLLGGVHRFCLCLEFGACRTDAGKSGSAWYASTRAS